MSKILAVDSVLLFREIIRFKYGDRLLTADNYLTALRLFDENQPRVVISELLDFKQNEYSFAHLHAQVRKAVRYTPIIAYSNFLPEEARELDQKLGAEGLDVFLPKSQDAQLLSNLVEKLLDNPTEYRRGLHVIESRGRGWTRHVSHGF